MGQLPQIPERLRRIDELTWLEHHHIDIDDDCYYIWERTSGARFDQYATNDFIKNLQITPVAIEADASRTKWKKQALLHAIKALGCLVPADWRSYTFVPVPPHCVKSDPDHDRRLFTILKHVTPPLDFREMVLLRENTVAKQKQVSPEERAANYYLADDVLTGAAPDHIMIFDDVVSGASHFKAVKMTLREQFPDVPISGLFLARAVRPPVAEQTDA